MFFPEYFETVETASLRLAHNLKAAANAEGAATTADVIWVEMPTPAGVAHVELKASDPIREDTPANNRRRGSAARLAHEELEGTEHSGAHFEAHLPKRVRAIFSTIMNFVSGRGEEDDWAADKFRRWPQPPDETTTRRSLLSEQDARIMCMRSRTTHRKLDNDLPPLTAEDAKAKATHAAQQSEMVWLRSHDKYNNHKPGHSLSA
mmetsp:Transcript_22737/g.56518  ORF Transcript_22737/g.56518 Transcript_22737/m.56518 type:complete len:205 (-) Transcript_22737:303-917(-)